MALEVKLHLYCAYNDATYNDKIAAFCCKPSARGLFVILKRSIPFITGAFLYTACIEKTCNMKGIKKAICRKVKNPKQMRTSQIAKQWWSG